MTSIAQNRESDQRKIAGTLKYFFTGYGIQKRVPDSELGEHERVQKHEAAGVQRTV